MMLFPPIESNHRKAVPGAGWGREVIFQPAYNNLLFVNINRFNSLGISFGILTIF